jgi:iron complex outermembrane recepter protein
MRVIGKSLLAGASLLSIAVPAFAQDASESGEGVNSGEIVVQARRRDESAQDVPVVVNAVTSEDLSKLNIREFDDITSVVPGLSLSPNSSGIGGGVSTIRGVNFDSYSSGSNGTVEFYMNDAPVGSGIVYQAMYDIGQIEVLRGPQGTLRGRASPSGSITVTTRKPDLNEAGGYVMGTVNDLNGHNLNGAINIPIVEGKLGVRVAGLTSQDRGNRVTPVEGADFTPRNDTESLRASVSADPFDGVLLLDFNYLTITRNSNQYDQVESLDQVITDGSVAPSPVTIGAKDRNAYRGLSYPFRQQFRNYNWQARLSQWGQRLTYVGNRMEQDIRSQEPMDKAGVFADPSFEGKTFNQTVYNSSKYDSHELRLQNEERIFDMVDYVVGAMSYKVSSPTDMERILSATATPPPNPELTSVLFSPFLRYNDTTEESIYGNVTVHFGQGTEISGGLRKIWYEFDSGGSLGGVDVPSLRRAGNEGKTIYTASVKHRFNDDLMVYASTGSSWRPSISAVGGPAVPSDLQDSFINLPAETSKSYEIGFKSNWLDNRLMVNLTAYHQKFDNYPYRSAGLGVYAIDRSNPAAPLVKQFNYVAAVPVEVNGFELEVSGKPMDNWDIGVSVSYADGKIKNGNVPCLDLNNDGVPDTVLTAPTLPEMEAAVGADNIGTCSASFRSSNSSPWNASIQSEYSMAVNDKAEAYLRGLFAWKGNSIGDPGNAFDSVDSYGMLNAYLGVRDPDGAWDITAYAKNLTNAFRVVTRSNGPLATSLRSPGTLSYTNYFGVSVTEPREFGVTARFAFGSR